MQVIVSSDLARSVVSGALVVPVFSDKKLEGAAADVDPKLGGVIASALAEGEHQGKSNEVALFHATGDLGVRRVLVVGLGDRAKFELSSLAQYAGTALRYLGRRGVHEIAFALPYDVRDPKSAASFLVEGAFVAFLDTTLYRKEQERPIEVKTIAIVAGAADRSALTLGAKRGQIIGKSVNFTRRLALTPANDMTPRILAERAEEVAKKKRFRILRAR